MSGSSKLYETLDNSHVEIGEKSKRSKNTKKKLSYNSYENSGVGYVVIKGNSQRSKRLEGKGASSKLNKTLDNSDEETEGKSGYSKKSESDGVENAWNMEVPKWKKGDMKHKLAEMSDFAVTYPKYRDPYLKNSFPILKKILKEQGIAAELDMLHGSMTVRTTNDTWDPYAILLARDVIKLVARTVPVERAIQVFDPNITSEIIKIRDMVRDLETFKKRRNRLLGKDNQTLVALEKLTKCMVNVQGHTVAIIGPHQGVLTAMEIVEECMNNVHPLHLLNAAFIRKSLAEDPQMKNEDWSRMLPEFKPKAVQKKKSKKKRIVKGYEVFPPAQPESKMDKQLAEGEYFVKNTFKRKQVSQEEQRLKSHKIQTAKRAQQYIAPEEPVAKKSKTEGKSKEVDLAKLKKKIKMQKKKTAEDGKTKMMRAVV